MKTRTYVYGNYVVTVTSDDDDKYHRYKYNHFDENKSFSLGAEEGLSHYELPSEYILETALKTHLEKIKQERKKCQDL